LVHHLGTLPAPELGQPGHSFTNRHNEHCQWPHFC